MENGAEKPFREAFIRYLRNSAGHYNQVKTMATEPPRQLPSLHSAASA